MPGMSNNVKLSIVNYGFNIRSKMTDEQKREDDLLMKSAKKVVDSMNYGKGAIMITEAYHTDLRNNNNYIYVSKNMDTKIKSFFDPFPTPFLCFHNDESKPVGTNIGAKFIRKEVQTSRGNATGYGKIATFIPEKSKFQDELTLDLIRDRRFTAVSIGSQTKRSEMMCNICNNSIFSNECEHMPGKEYEEGICGILIDNTRFCECSMAGGIPADIDAMIKRVDLFDTDGSIIKADNSISDMMHDPWSIAIYDNAIISQYNIGKEFSGVDNMSIEDNKSISELISSYDKIINGLKSDNESLIIALTNANNTIISLKSKGSENTEKNTEENIEENTELNNENTENEIDDNTSIDEIDNSSEEGAEPEENPGEKPEDGIENNEENSEENTENENPLTTDESNTDTSEKPEEKSNQITAKESIKQIRSSLMEQAVNKGNNLKSNSYLLRNTK